MNFNEYQEQTALTAKYPKEKALDYCTLGLVGEAGEIANKVKKVIRIKNLIGSSTGYERFRVSLQSIGNRTVLFR